MMRFTPARGIVRDSMISKPFSTLFDSLLRDDMFSHTAPGYFKPRTDVVEKEQAFEIHMSLPGLKKEDIKIDLKDNQVTVSGERKINREEKGVRYLMSENLYGAFSRTFSLPENVKSEGITAAFENGILALTLPKKEVAAPVTISIS